MSKDAHSSGHAIDAAGPPEKKRYEVWFHATHSWIGGIVEAESQEEAERIFDDRGGYDDAFDELLGGCDTPSVCHQCPSLGDPSEPEFGEEL